jgi:hypothetical protein
MLISRFEEIKMMEDETFREFYSKMSDLKKINGESWENRLRCKTHL